MAKMMGAVCPKCGSNNIEIISSMTANISGGTTKKKQCKDCGKIFYVYIPRNGFPILQKGGDTP